MAFAAGGRLAQTLLGKDGGGAGGGGDDDVGGGEVTVEVGVRDGGAAARVSEGAGVVVGPRGDDELCDGGLGEVTACVLGHVARADDQDLRLDG